MGVIDSDSDKYVTINFEETELRLGLPGGSDLKSVGSSSSSSNNNNSCNGKRGFLETVDLKLELSSTKECCGKGGGGVVEENSKGNNLLSSPNDPAKPPSKAQVVGWPPIRSFRKNVMAVQKSGTAANDGEKTTTTTATAAASTSGAAFVKVSMDGAPYLRKVDLNLYKSYRELSNALGQMFSSFTFRNCGSQRMKDFMNESKLVDLLSGSEYVPTYEDKDGDWMLVGDVPWELFVDSCKRLRIVKGSEAIGLAPRAVEKCKNKS